jgi:hypothetical protein
MPGDDASNAVIFASAEGARLFRRDNGKAGVTLGGAMQPKPGPVYRSGPPPPPEA